MEHYIAFTDHKLLASGALLTIALEVKKHLEQHPNQMVLIFSVTTGQQIDIDIRGNEADLVKKFATTDEPENPVNETPPVGKRGRPKLGVVGREVTLLPRHWQWLDTQRGGASATLRRLIEKARKANAHQDLKRHAQDKTNRFISAIAGNLPGFEEATRALFAGDQQRFIDETKNWPKDIQTYTYKFSEDAFI